MRLVVSAAMICAAGLMARPCIAGGLVLSVVQDPSSHADLNALMAGQSVTFDVNLSGLDIADGQQLAALEGTVVFDASLLGQPSAISPGAVVPDSSGFLPAPSQGVADASYVSLFSNSGALIDSNGVFFTFTVVVQPDVSGSGVLSLNPNNGGFVSAFDPDFNPVTVTPGADLPFTVVNAVIPEPDSMTLAFIALGLLLGTGGFARNRPARIARASISEPGG
jgi:hypothetical protein